MVFQVSLVLSWVMSQTQGQYSDSKTQWTWENQIKIKNQKLLTRWVLSSN